MKTQTKSKSSTWKILLIPLILLKALFNAVTNLAWGSAGIWLFGIALAYFVKETGKIPTEVSKIILTLQVFILEHSMLFFTAFFVLYVVFDLMELFEGKK